MEDKEGFIPVDLKVRKFIPKNQRKEGGPEYEWENYGFNMCNMNNWRPYVGEEEDGTPMLYTMLYMEGNPKGIILGISGDEFLRLCREAVVKWKEETKKEPV